MFSIPLQAGTESGKLNNKKGKLNNLICAVHFTNNFNNVLHKKGLSNSIDNLAV